MQFPLIFIHPIHHQLILSVTEKAGDEKMVGLSIVLESQKGPQVINKTTMSKSMLRHHHHHHQPSSSSSNSHRSGFQIPTFLDQCFLCGKRLSPGKDIYMYKGDKAFCSVECRYKQIFMDEEDGIQIENCSLAAMRPPSSTSSSAPPDPPHHRKAPRNRARGGFAY